MGVGAVPKQMKRKQRTDKAEQKGLHQSQQVDLYSHSNGRERAALSARREREETGNNGFSFYVTER